MNALKQNYGLLLVLVAFLSPSSLASVTVSLDEPNWSFTLKQPLGDTARPRVNRQEGEFFSQVQKDLDAQNYTAVITAFDAFAKAQEQISPMLHEMMGQVFLSAKQNEQAKQHFLAALKKGPSMPAAQRGLSMIYMLEQNYAKAREHLSQALILGMTDSQMYGQLGYLNLQLEHPRSAIAAYQNAMMLDIDNNQWKQGLLFALIASDALPQARSLADEMLAAQPDDRRLWLQRSQIAMKAGDDVTAISSLETAVSLGEKNVANLVMLTKLHVRSGSPHRAVTLLKTHAGSLLASGKDGSDAILSIGNWLVANQDWQNLSVLVEVSDSHSEAFSSASKAALNVMKANLAMAKQQITNAQKYLLSALKTSPANGDALLTLAGLLRQQNKDERAKMYYLRAEALPDYKTRAVLGRAQIAINQRSYAEALTLLRQVYKDNPSRNDLLSNIQSLENIVNNAS
ncbi:tetratricopeptide repeat protein [Alteromonas sp. C1M14]|uniref:tetratricopeptide repeat protein n=1 Tax=Alteromonas sp. C1M14 TaxID=2841567 RepID=UPI001C089F4F|nr:tetratricopeptide repeat protein [Alteromonas sp. C1M14]MBU2978290.1 tetratricopeptide repeat protein [Alteromonas sp. C1M14]